MTILRSLFMFCVFVTGTMLASAIQITGGSLYSSFGSGNYQDVYNLTGSNLAIGVKYSSTLPDVNFSNPSNGTCNVGGATCAFNFDFSPTFSTTNNSTPFDGTLQSISYNGVTYDLTGANTFTFALNLTVAGGTPTVPATVSGNPQQAYTLFLQSPNIPFSMTGAASFTYNGASIFSAYNWRALANRSFGIRRTRRETPLECMAQRSRRRPSQPRSL